jgi:hypothetical protein
MKLPESGAAFERVAATYDADSTDALVSRQRARAALELAL